MVCLHLHCMHKYLLERFFPLLIVLHFSATPPPPENLLQLATVPLDPCCSCRVQWKISCFGKINMLTNILILSVLEGGWCYVFLRNPRSKKSRVCLLMNRLCQFRSNKLFGSKKYYSHMKQFNAGNKFIWRFQLLKSIHPRPQSFAAAWCCNIRQPRSPENEDEVNQHKAS